MTKNLQEIALSFFLVMSGIAIITGILWVKPVLDAQRLLIEETRANQEKIMQNAEEARIILTELGYAAGVFAMMENRMIQPVEANKMIEESLNTITTHSERFGKLTKLINDFRINEQQGRR